MLVTLTNTSGGDLNNLALGPDGIATGGVRENALPYPFGHIGTLADTAAKQLPMHPSDLTYNRTNLYSPTFPWEHFETMIKAGQITVVVADQPNLAPYGAFDELFMIEVG